jgi:hypothetical protein
MFVIRLDLAIHNSLVLASIGPPSMKGMYGDIVCNLQVFEPYATISFFHHSGLVLLSTTQGSYPSGNGIEYLLLFSSLFCLTWGLIKLSISHKLIHDTCRAFCFALLAIIKDFR